MRNEESIALAHPTIRLHFILFSILSSIILGLYSSVKFQGGKEISLRQNNNMKFIN